VREIIPATLHEFITPGVVIHI